MKIIRKFGIKTKDFILSDHFPIFLAICLFFSSLLDSDITGYILRTNPELFHSNEAGVLAKHFLDTPYWWISSFAYALLISTLFFVAYTNNLKSNWCKRYFKELSKPKDEIQWILFIRLLCLYASFCAFLSTILWWRHL